MGRLLDGRFRFHAARTNALIGRAARTAMPDQSTAPGGVHEGVDRLLLLQGVRAAAWLMRQHRRQLRQHGAVRFHLPRRAEVPAWFARAMMVLEKRPGWSMVAIRSGDGQKVSYTVRWKGRAPS